MSDNNFIIANYKFRHNLYRFFMLLIMTVLVSSICWLLSHNLHAIFILLAIVMLFMSWPTFSETLILNFYQAKEVSEDQNPELLHTVNMLSQSAGFQHVPKVYASQIKAMTAFTIKIDGIYAIVVSDLLLMRLNKAEVKAVIAHEISHIYNDDINITRLSDGMCQFIQAMSTIGLVMLCITPLLGSHYGTASWPLLLFLFMSYFLSNLLQLSLSRSREFHADVIAVQLTSDVNAMVSALNKIEFKRTSWLNNMLNPQNKAHAFLRTHPSTHDRIRCLLGLDMLSSFNKTKKY